MKSLTNLSLSELQLQQCSILCFASKYKLLLSNSHFLQSLRLSLTDLKGLEDLAQMNQTFQLKCIDLSNSQLLNLQALQVLHQAPCLKNLEEVNLSNTGIVLPTNFKPIRFFKRLTIISCNSITSPNILQYLQTIKSQFFQQKRGQMQLLEYNYQLQTAEISSLMCQSRIVACLNLHNCAIPDSYISEQIKMLFKHDINVRVMQNPEVVENVKNTNSPIKYQNVKLEDWTFFNEMNSQQLIIDNSIRKMFNIKSFEQIKELDLSNQLNLDSTVIKDLLNSRFTRNLNKLNISTISIDSSHLIMIANSSQLQSLEFIYVESIDIYVQQSFIYESEQQHQIVFIPQDTSCIPPINKCGEYRTLQNQDDGHILCQRIQNGFIIKDKLKQINDYDTLSNIKIKNNSSEPCFIMIKSSLIENSNKDPQFFIDKLSVIYQDPKKMVSIELDIEFFKMINKKLLQILCSNNNLQEMINLMQLSESPTMKNQKIFKPDYDNIFPQTYSATIESHQNAIGPMGCWHIQENLLQNIITQESKNLGFRLQNSQLTKADLDVIVNGFTKFSDITSFRMDLSKNKLIGEDLKNLISKFTSFSKLKKLFLNFSSTELSKQALILLLSLIHI
eukprot:TRINITY_DN13548_c0_g1_i1.p1 TRINITY_DN13548_c0_g1~~TRINITY_DN13548_c0_g1_i1.p1  ORF type:complete len:617 (+),score=65.00 TRINITY_DN13548_c0_g1_i1:566-2416(+)